MQSLPHQPSQLEQDLVALHSGTTQSKEWFAQSITNILESPSLASYAKADQIAEVFISIDAKINYIKEQQRLLASLKKQLELAKATAKVEVSTALTSFGVSKLEGLAISSITVSEATHTTKATLEILDEDALITAGYYKVTVDTDAVEQALLSADKRSEVEAYAYMDIELVHKPATIRINKRKSVAQEEPTPLAA